MMLHEDNASCKAESIQFARRSLICITEQECIPVGCVPSAAVAVYPATHALPPPPAMHAPLWTEFLTHLQWSQPDLSNNKTKIKHHFVKITSLFSKNKTHFSRTNTHIFLLFLHKIPFTYTVSIPLIKVYNF